MLLWLLACWKNVSQVIPYEEAKKWNEQIIVESQNEFVQIDVRAGSAQDPIGKEGLAYLVAHSIFPKDLRVDIVVGREHVRFRLPVSIKNEKKLINIIIDSMINPIWSLTHLENTKINTKNEIHEWLGSTYLSHDLFRQWMYSGHPYGHAPFGGHQSLDSISDMDIHSFYAQYYVRSGMSLGWQGKAYRRSIVEEIQEGLSGLPTHIPKYATPVSLSIPKEAQVIYVYDESQEQVVTSWGLMFAQATAEQRTALLIAQEYLCPFEEVDRLEHLFSVYDPLAQCSFSAQTQDEMLGELERLEILFRTMKDLDDTALLKLQLKGQNTWMSDRLASLSRKQLFPDISDDILEIEAIREAIQELQKQQPKILIISPYKTENTQEIEEFLTIPVLVIESSLDDFVR